MKECEGCGKEIKSRRFCNTCRVRKLKTNNPIAFEFNRIKQRARQRGKPFVIMFEDFKQWVMDTDYLNLKGRGKDDGSIDCIVDELGYAKGNLQLLTVSQNTIKYQKDLKNRKGWGIPGCEKQPNDIF